MVWYRGKKKKPESDVDDVALRAYELSKLRYYYAIAECDCANTADKLYQELDGLELEHSSVALDLRMVPDDVGYERKSLYVLDY